MSGPSTARPRPRCSRRSSLEAEQGRRGRLAGRGRRWPAGAPRQAGRDDGRLARGRAGHPGLSSRARAADREHQPARARSAARSSGARTPSASSPTTQPSSDWSVPSGSRPATSGRSRAAPCPCRPSPAWCRPTPSGSPQRRPDRPRPPQRPALLHHTQGHDPRCCARALGSSACRSPRSSRSKAPIRSRPSSAASSPAPPPERAGRRHPAPPGAPGCAASHRRTRSRPRSTRSQPPGSRAPRGARAPSEPPSRAPPARRAPPPSSSPGPSAPQEPTPPANPGRFRTPFAPRSALPCPRPPQARQSGPSRAFWRTGTSPARRTRSP